MTTVSSLNINGNGYDIDAKTFNGYSTGAFASSGHTHSQYQTTAAMTGYSTTGHTHSQYQTTAAMTGYSTTGHTHSQYQTTAAMTGYSTTGHTHSQYQTTAAMTGYSTTGHTHDNLTRRQSCYSSNTYSTGYFLLAQWKGGSGTSNHDASIAGVFTQGAINYEFKAGARASGATVNTKYNYVNTTTDALVITYEVATSDSNRIILRVYSKITANWQRSTVFINAVTNGDVYSPSNINSSDLTLPGTYSTTTIGTVISQSTVVGSHTHEYAAKNGNYSASGLIAASASYSTGTRFEAGTDNVSRPVPFAWGDENLWKNNASFSSTLIYDSNFKYNPSTHALTVSSIDCSIPGVYNGIRHLNNGRWSFTDDENSNHKFLPIIFGPGFKINCITNGIASSTIPTGTLVYEIGLPDSMFNTIDFTTSNSASIIDYKNNAASIHSTINRQPSRGDWWAITAKSHTRTFTHDELKDGDTQYFIGNSANNDVTAIIPLSSIDVGKVYTFMYFGTRTLTMELKNTTSNNITLYTSLSVSGKTIASNKTETMVVLNEQPNTRSRIGKTLTLCYYDDSHIMAGYEYIITT